jgi:hypothetical protein
MSSEWIRLRCLFLGVWAAWRAVVLDSSLVGVSYRGKCAVTLFWPIGLVVNNDMSTFAPLRAVFRQPVLEFVASADAESLIDSASPLGRAGDVQSERQSRTESIMKCKYVAAGRQ